MAALALDMEGREAAVKSVTRGDTSVTYAVADGQAAALAGTIPYELLCAVSPRVPRVYLERR